MDMIRAQEQKRDLHDQFQHQVGVSVWLAAPLPEPHQSISWFPSLTEDWETYSSDSSLFPCSSSAPTIASL